MDGRPMNMQPMQMPVSMSMSMPMSNVAPGPGVSVPMGMGMNVHPQQYGQPPMMMNMGMPMNPMGMGMGNGSMNTMQGPPPMTSADWRVQVTREHRANLIAKIYNELVEVSSEPPPGIKLWMNVAWYELQLYKESRTQEDYINKIFNRLKTLRTQQRDQLAAMNAQGLPNRGKLNRLDFSYYNTMNMNPRASPPSLMGNPHYGQYPNHPGGQAPKPSTPHGANPAALNGMAVDIGSDYWRQHAALKEKYHEDVEKVHSAFKKYVDHMKDQEETDQKKKLRYLLSYVQLCASVLSEDRSTHQPRKLEELDKVYKYIVKIVNPYLKKLRTETDKRTFPGENEHSGPNGNQPVGSSTQNNGSTRNSVSGPPPAQASKHPSTNQPTPIPNNPGASSSTQANMHQQYQQMQQQRQQQAHQQQAHQQRVQQIRQQHQPSPSQPPNTNQPPTTTQTSPNHTPQRAQQPQGQPSQPPSNKPTAAQTPSSQTLSHGNGSSNSLSAGLGLTLDDTSLYSGMDNGLLPMPSATGSSTSFMNFGNDLSPTNFSSGMDLGMLDMDSTGGLYGDSQDTPTGSSDRPSGTNVTSGNTGNGSDTKNGNDSNDSGDLLNFVEVL